MPTLETAMLRLSFLATLFSLIVLAEPRRGAKIVGRYKRTETMPVILGKARGAPYYYVSPCHACESGFVEQALLRRGNAR